MRSKFNQWLESLWFKPAGFFDNVQSATMQFVFIPFWMFDVKVQTAYRGKPFAWQPWRCDELITVYLLQAKFAGS